MPQEIVFYIAEKIDGKWVRDERTANNDARNLEPLVARRNTRAKEMGLTARHKIVRVVIDVIDWQAREADRMRDGTYKRLPKEWYFVDTLYPNHFCHLTDKPGYVAYTPDEAHGNQDKQMVTLAGTYLRKYFGKHFPAETIDDLREVVGDTDGILTVHMTDDGKEIAAVYMHGGPGGPTNSCMSYERSHWPNGRHPCEFYGKPGNLALAYTMTTPKRTDPDCTITARTIVNTELKVWGRTYGFERDVRRIEKWLKAQGYKQAGSGRGDKPEMWAGSTFKTEAYKEYGEKPRYYTPHIDFCHIMHLDPKSLMFKLFGKGEVIPENHKPFIVYTNGVWAIPVAVCEKCRQGKQERNVVIYDEKGLHPVAAKWCRACVADAALKSCAFCASITNKLTLTGCYHDGPREYNICPKCVRTAKHCNECRLVIVHAGTYELNKYNKQHTITKRAVNTCKSCYYGLITKYRVWGNPNF